MTYSSAAAAGQDGIGEATRDPAFSGAPAWPACLRNTAALVADMPAPAFVAWGPELTLISNDAFGSLLAAAPGRPMREALPGLWRLAGAQVERALAGESKVQERLQLSAAGDGGSKPVWCNLSLSPVRDEHGAVAGVLGICHDVSHYVANERSFSQSEAHYRTLFDSMDEGFCVIEFFDGPHGPSSDYIHIEANPAYARHAGIPDVVGQKVREMVGDEADGWVELYRGVLLTGEPIRFERELVATKRHLALSAFRIEPASRRQVAVLFQDITARKTAERELQKLNETLEVRVADAIAERRETEAALRQAQKMEAVGQLTGGLAHDFNNLLAGIAGAFEMIGLRLAQGRSADVEKYLSAGQHAARRAAALTHRLLAFSRRQTLSPKPTVINRLLGDFVELVRRTVGPAIEVETIAAVGLWPTLVDSNQLENALLNLCINARDAMPDGGKLTLETGNKWLDQRAAHERGMEPGQYVTVTVSDTGTGIDRETLPRVFDPFFTTKPMGQGTGLGLSMVYGFARQSNGHVRIYSEVGEGTTVCIYLPRYFGEESADQPDTVSIPAHAEAGETVLVIDDEPTVRMLITDALGDVGYTCVEAADGAAGLKILQSNEKIDLLITDVGLPGGLNGRQVADAARALRSDLKVLFITGYAENAALNHGHIERGMEVLTKPFAVDELAARVERILRKGGRDGEGDR